MDARLERELGERRGDVGEQALLMDAGLTSAMSDEADEVLVPQRISLQWMATEAA